MTIYTQKAHLEAK